MYQILTSSTRSIANVTQNNHGRSTLRAVTNRFRRTGAGLWFRAIPGRRKKIWKNLYFQRTGEDVPFSYGGHNHIPTFGDRTHCDRVSLTYDMMVNKYHRQQRWHVRNAYEGYDRYTKMWYYPGRHDEDPANFPENEGFHYHMRAYADMSNHSFDSENAYYEYCATRHSKTYLDHAVENLEEEHIEDMKKTVEARNKRIVPKDL